ncbi:PD-(D/E)XK nuclease family protein [Orrella daihaiensis]|uniref:PD-(D/E)XK nuclease family protein n=1 Tax=Orrella daihaiensis TaxID=2782176 RepID=A0ABY4AI11_9BURK|nr:PD-(D/E)XK nuclease family protein [Orrella daihaiensis]UOD49933.1 PD-(D/E)XK nuclease family protein [Orrella daihaiensis]
MRELPFAATTLAELSTLSPANTLVLTVNNRLARTLTAKLAETVKAGAAELVKIEPWAAWLTNQVVERLYADGIEGFSRVLDTQTTRLVWAEAISATEGGRSLIDTDQVAAIAADADALLLNWHIDVPSSMHTPDYERFLAWRSVYEHRLAKLDAIDVSRVSGHVAKWISSNELDLPANIVLMGFTELTAAMRTVLDAMQAAGVAVSYLTALQQTDATSLTKVALATPEQQWLAAITWAHDRLHVNPEGRYAIVVPSLQNEATEARRLLERELGGLAYNVAVAPPLSQWPLGHAMLSWLRLVIELGDRGRVEPAVAGQALLAGGCAASTSEAGARAMLDARWRHRQSLLLSMAQWQDDINDLPRLAQAWQAAITAWQKIARGKQSWFDWANGFRRILLALGFPGEGTQTSVQYQTTSALDQLMSALAALDDSLDAPDARGAWKMLSRLARQTLFQPQRDPDARLDVLGLLEAEGGRWDGVWVMGMTDEVLPAVINPNPLIPVTALAQAGAPRSTAQRELEWATQLMQALQRSGDEVIFSWPERDGEKPNRPSPLLATLPFGEAAIGNLDRELPPPIQTQTWSDGQPLALTSAEVIRGGVSVVQTQAANPLWAFFQHRLNVRGLPPHAQWPANFDRGQFLHRILELLWTRWGTQTRMLEQTSKPHWPDELRLLIEKVAADKLAQWPEALRELEQQRGFEVIDAWLAFEAAREPFKVVECERDHDFIEGPLSLRLTIDRVDELASGQRVVFDYKSGSTLPQPATDWQSMALRNAQLLVYASTLSSEGRTPDALGWIWLHAAGIEVKGLAAEPIEVPGIAPLGQQKWAEYDWDEQIKRWDARVRQLAREFAAGGYENRFWQRKDMDYCTIKPLLRVHAEPDDE